MWTDPVLLGTLFAALLLAVYGIVLYNRFISLRYTCDEGFAGIDVQLKRRHDLVPQLVSVVKGAAAFEKDVLNGVTEARARAQGAQDLRQREAAEQALGASLGRFLAVAEAYPELKAVQSFLQLQEQLARLEDELQLARRYFNACVRDHNTFGQSFPALLLAGLAGFKPRDYFLLEDRSQAEPPALGL